MIKSSRSYYWCVVPMCKNTSIKNPEKTFICVPTHEKRRKLWLSTVRRNHKEFSKTSCVYVCEDHFDLETDMENYVRWKMMGGTKLMKPNAVPHKFEFQIERKLTCSKSMPCEGAVERSRLQEIEEDLLSISSTSKILTEKDIDGVDLPKEHIFEGEPKKKDIGVITVKPYLRNKQTQTPRDFHAPP